MLATIDDVVITWSPVIFLILMVAVVGGFLYVTRTRRR